MADKLSQRVSRQKCGDGRGAQFNLLSARGNAHTEFIVVGEIVEQCTESADGLEVATAKRQG